MRKTNYWGSRRPLHGQSTTHFVGTPSHPLNKRKDRRRKVPESRTLTSWTATPSTKGRTEGGKYCLRMSGRISLNAAGYDRIAALAGYRKEDFSVCLGCRICASVCTVNDLGTDVNPQDLLARLFLGEEVRPDDHLVRYCTGCYRCTSACPWNIRIPEVVRALRESLGMASPFEKAFKGSIGIWGRVYEPYVFLMSLPFLVKEGYLKHMTKWMEYMSFHLPHRARRK